MCSLFTVIIEFYLGVEIVDNRRPYAENNRIDEILKLYYAMNKEFNQEISQKIKINVF